MSEHVVKLYRSAIPVFQCLPGCHDCCGPVAASRWELAQLPPVDAATRRAKQAKLTCPHLGEHGCTVYADRPLLCRIFGTVPDLPCPRGRRPLMLLDNGTEAAINRFFRNSPHGMV